MDRFGFAFLHILNVPAGLERVIVSASPSVYNGNPRSPELLTESYQIVKNNTGIWGIGEVDNNLQQNDFLFWQCYLENGIPRVILFVFHLQPIVQNWLKMNNCTS